VGLELDHLGLQIGVVGIRGSWRQVHLSWVNEWIFIGIWRNWGSLIDIVTNSGNRNGTGKIIPVYIIAGWQMQIFPVRNGCGCGKRFVQI
jgi:hypothetical protein